jgi:hypothetical protein
MPFVTTTIVLAPVSVADDTSKFVMIVAGPVATAIEL